MARIGAPAARVPARRRAAAIASSPRRLLLATCALGAAAAAARCVAPLCWAGSAASGRRGFFAAVSGAVLAAGSGDNEAHAFDNAVKKIKREINNPKRPGRQPTDLGLTARAGQLDNALKGCDEATPNCFSTTYDIIDSGLHDYPKWEFSGKSPEAAYQDLVDVVNAYQPGQQGIDGGGFKVLVQDSPCIYTQFESLKRGHLDDVELCLDPGSSSLGNKGAVLVRSSARQGYFDYGVNAARLNTLAQAVESKGGWKTSQITMKTHQRYWTPNCIGGDGAKAPFSTRTSFPAECKEVPIQSESSLFGKM